MTLGQHISELAKLFQVGGWPRQPPSDSNTDTSKSPGGKSQKGLSISVVVHDESVGLPGSKYSSSLLTVFGARTPPGEGSLTETASKQKPQTSQRQPRSRNLAKTASQRQLRTTAESFSQIRPDPVKSCSKSRRRQAQTTATAPAHGLGPSTDKRRRDPRGTRKDTTCCSRRLPAPTNTERRYVCT
jgi:hypothetical protein